MGSIRISSDDYKTEMDQVYTTYYSGQLGGGLSHIGPLYATPRVLQHGRGVGSFFASLFRTIKPLLFSGVNAIKNQALDTSKAILSDFGRKPLRNILEEQGKHALNNLSEKVIKKISSKFQQGSGKRRINHRNKKRTRQSRKRSKVKNTKNKKNKTNKKKIRNIKDIFSK